jgi:hypothetical protein
VCEYSGTHLTYAKDKLVAFSAVAKSIQAASKTITGKEWTYYAGLWAPYTEFQLLWYALKPAASPTEYRAPSWSWAATDGSNWISNDWYCNGKGKETTFIQIRDIQIFHRGSDPFLEVERGFMLLVCWLWTLDLTYPGQPLFAETGLELVWDVVGTLESLEETTCLLPIRVNHKPSWNSNSKYSWILDDWEDIDLKGLIVERRGSQFQRRGVFSFKMGSQDKNNSALWIYMIGARMHNLGIISANPFGPPNPWLSPDTYVFQLWTRYTVQLI